MKMLLSGLSGRVVLRETVSSQDAAILGSMLNHLTPSLLSASDVDVEN